MKKIILFDFDGVIVDSYEIAYKVSKKLIPEIDREQHRDMFMGNIYDAVAKIVPKHKRKERNDDFYNIYYPLLLKLPIIPGMSKTIKQLSKKYTLIIISSTINSPIHAYLEKNELHHYFEKVYGADVHTDKKKKIMMVLKNYKVVSKDCLFITDTVGDLLEAQYCKINTLVVTWGFHQKHRFKKTPPVDFIEKPEEMVAKVDKYFEKK